MQSFNAGGKIYIALESLDLESPIYLAMRKLTNFSVAALMQKVELLNSQNKFKIDNSFGIHITWTVIALGGGEKKKECPQGSKEKTFFHLNCHCICWW